MRDLAQEAEDSADIVYRFPDICQYPEQLAKLYRIIELCRQMGTSHTRMLDTLAKGDKDPTLRALNVIRGYKPAYYADHMLVDLQAELDQDSRRRVE